MSIAVAILNYNGKQYLEEFLPSVIEHSKSAQIWVIDNCSTDDSVAFIKSNHPSIQIIINESNGGFAKGYNDGLKHIKADYYVLLNSDVLVTENWITPCIEVLEQDNQIAAVQPKVLSYKNRNSFEHAGAAGGFLDRNYYPFCRGRIFEIIEEDKGQYDDVKEIFWATGACLFIRSDKYHEFGGFDEDFFAHMEEIDLCWRLKRQNLKIFYCGLSHVYHVGGGTLSYMSPRKTYLNFRNSLFMIFKNHNGPVITKIFHRLLYDTLGGVLFISKFQFRHFWAILRAHIALYINFKTLYRKRNSLKENAQNYNQAGLYNKNITIKKFINGVKKYSELDSSDFYK
jgi:GT2 family glycosyltransferase